jgi:hypothetical protein
MATGLLTVSPEVRGRLYERQARGEPVVINGERDFGDGNWSLHVWSDLIPVDSELRQEVFFRDDGSFGFKPYRPDFAEC